MPMFQLTRHFALRQMFFSPDLEEADILFVDTVYDAIYNA